MKTEYDIIVIGAGIHGAGVAQAAAAAGYSVLLLERRHPAFGTSSRSSKLVHGGLRYLESLQFGLVRQALHERRMLTKLAPDLVRLVPFTIPIYESMSRSPFLIRAGLSFYALLGGLHSDVRFKTVSRSEWGKELSGIRPEGLRAVFRYYDAQTDDAALTRAVLRSADDLGARILYPAEFLSASRNDLGYHVKYLIPGGLREVSCLALIVAAGPWMNTVLDRISSVMNKPVIELVRGSHVFIDAPSPKSVFYIESPFDRRPVFVMPWRGQTLVGTTEMSVREVFDDPKPAPEEIAYLLQTYGHYFPSSPVRLIDSFAGFRVLSAGKGSVNARSRDVQFVFDEVHQPRLVAIYDGKLTTYRSAAQRTLRLIQRSLPRRKRIADTALLKLPPAD